MVNNTAQASDPILAQNAWDNNYPNGGNFWSDYQGVDNCSGPSQNICSGSDGIGDTAYNITTDVADRYPLVSPVQPPVNSDIAILSATADQIMRIQGQNGTITVEVQNNGAVPESFPVYPIIPDRLELSGSLLTLLPRHGRQVANSSLKTLL